jgi:hypothetical protein
LGGLRRVFGGGSGRKNAKIGERNGGADGKKGSKRGKTATARKEGKTHKLFLRSKIKDGEKWGRKTAPRRALETVDAAF